MNNIKDTFSIQDLELLTGIKAHTIRIWEKRYDILNPTRLGRNIRVYSLNDLQKILNLSLLYQRDFKISKLAKLSESELSREIQKVATDQIKSNFAVNELIIAMYSLNSAKFEEIYELEMTKSNFKDVFIEVFIPLLHHIGMLWQTDAIKPAYERFISNLIYQKIQGNIEALPKDQNSESIFALFLPDKEIHELGILFLNYCLKLKGHKTIYLGKSIPIDDLAFINGQFDKITWVTSFIIDQTEEDKIYFLKMITNLLENSDNELWIISSIWKKFAKTNANKQIHFYERYDELIDNN